LVPSEYLTEKLSWVDLFQARFTAPVNNPDKKDRKLRRLAAIFRSGAGSRRSKGGQFMRAGIAFLIVAYMLSQFYRAFLAVLAPALEADIGATTGISRVPRASGSRLRADAASGGLGARHAGATAHGLGAVPHRRGGGCGALRHGAGARHDHASP
jgi:hypothetical protein